MLEHALLAAQASTANAVVVVLGAHADKVIDRVNLHGAVPVICSDWEAGQSASLRAGLRAVREADAAVITLGDQPFVSTEAIDRVIEHRGGNALAVRATYGGAPNHPVAVERVLFDRLDAVTGDVGARDVLSSVPVRLVACDDVAWESDVDTPEELDRLERFMRLGGRRT